MSEHVATNSGFVQLSDAQYDTLRRFVQIIIPGLGVFYAALALLWHWGFIAEVTGTATALTVFGGVVLKFARDGYQPSTDANQKFDGEVAVVGVSDGGDPIAQIQLTEDAQQNFLTKPVLTIKGFNENA